MRLDQFIRGNDTMQKHVASDRGKRALVVVSPMARTAITREILPQLEDDVTSAKVAEELVSSAKAQIEHGFKHKDEVYTRLISYKSIDQSDNQFLRDLLIVMDEWVEKVKSSLNEKTVTTDKGEITVKVEVESGSDQNPAIEIKDSSDDQDVEVGEVAFDLLGLRL